MRRILVAIGCGIFLLSCSSTDSRHSQLNESESGFVLSSAGKVQGDFFFEPAVVPALTKCMKVQGFVYTTPKIRWPVDRLRTDSIEYAEEWGYGLSTTFDPKVPNGLEPDQVGLDSPGLSPYTSAMFGTDKVPGCIREANNATYGGSVRVDFLLARSSNIRKSVTELETDPRFSNSRRAWSRCLKAQGYTFTRLEDPRLYIDKKLFTPGFASEEVNDMTKRVERLRIEERKLAVADLQCRASSLPDLDKELRTVVEKESGSTYKQLDVR